MTAATADDGVPLGVEEPRGGGMRWGACFLAVLALHAGGVAALLHWHTPVESAAPPPAAVMIDLAPMPTAPAAEPMDTAPGPQQTEAEPPPPLPEPVVEPEPLPEPPPAPVPEAAVAVPPPPPVKPKPAQLRPEPRVEPKREPDPRPAAKATTAPPAAELPPAPAAAAPASGAPSVTASRAAPTWQGVLLGHLERHKRYPRAAQLRRQQGVSHVRFTIDREGKVLSARLDRSSGHEALDEETLALLERASPLPAPPPEIAQDRMEMVVPVHFTIR